MKDTNKMKSTTIEKNRFTRSDTHSSIRLMLEQGGVICIDRGRRDKTHTSVLNTDKLTFQSVDLLLQLLHGTLSEFSARLSLNGGHDGFD